MNRGLNGLKIIKIAGGSLLSMVAAEWLGLNYAASAAVITLLSIHDTKRETIRVMAKRMAAFLVALLLAPVCFYFLGYRPIAVGAFLLVFTPVCTLLNVQEGISVSTVLMTHFLTEGSVSAGNILNEVLLLLVGTGVGVAMNLYMPGKTGVIRQKQHRIESQFRCILAQMGDMLNGDGRCGGNMLKLRDSGDETVFSNLEEMLRQGEEDAYKEMENRLLAETKYYLAYMGLRKNQLLILRRIRSHLEWSDSFPGQARYLARLFMSVSSSFHEYNNARGLLKELEDVKQQMRLQPLPATREEFESRAVLFQVMLELEQFLVLKREFVDGLTQHDIRSFWQDGDNENT